MLNISQIADIVGVSSIELCEIQKKQAYLSQEIAGLEKGFLQWIEENESLNFDEVLTSLQPGYFSSLISGQYDQEFYTTQYRQAMHWRLNGVNQVQATMLINYIRKLMIGLAEKVESHDLAKGLCHVIDLSQSVVAVVYQISEEVNRMKIHVKHEVKRIHRSFGVISMEPPQALIKPYLDHQEWKFLAYSVALGEVDRLDDLVLSHHECDLAKWLKAGGEQMIPESVGESFHAAHQKIHELSHNVIGYANSCQPEKVLNLLHDMEAASDELSDILLNVIEDEFIRLATSDALTGMPNKRSFDIEFAKSLKLAERTGLWVGVLLIDVDHFKFINDEYGHMVGDQVLKKLSSIIRNAMRSDESAYRWGGEEFAVVILSDKPNSSALLAERIRKNLEKYEFTVDELTIHLTASCGCICFQPPISKPLHELFAQVDKLMYQAKEEGRNRTIHKVLDAS